MLIKYDKLNGTQIQLEIVFDKPVYYVDKKYTLFLYDKDGFKIYNVKIKNYNYIKNSIQGAIIGIKFEQNTYDIEISDFEKITSYGLSFTS
mgnify:CR=1 FL=1